MPWPGDPGDAGGAPSGCAQAENPARHQARARTHMHAWARVRSMGGAAPAWPGAARSCPSRRRCYYGDHQSAQWRAPTSCKPPLVTRERVRVRRVGGRDVCTGAAGEGGSMRSVRWEESAGSGARTSEKHRCRDRRPGRHQLRCHVSPALKVPFRDLAHGRARPGSNDMDLSFFVFFKCGRSKFSNSTHEIRTHSRSQGQSVSWWGEATRRSSVAVICVSRHQLAAPPSRGSAPRQRGNTRTRKNMRGTNCAAPMSTCLAESAGERVFAATRPAPFPHRRRAKKQHGGAGEPERKRAEKMWRDGDEGSRQAWRWACIHARGRSGLMPGAEHVFCLLDFPPQVPGYMNYLKPSLDGRSRAKERS